MKFLKKNGLLIAVIVFAFAAIAGSSGEWDHKKKCANHEKEVPAEKAWGKALPETLKVSIYSSKKGESDATVIFTSREVFGASFAMGGKKGGVAVELGGRIIPVKNGRFEALLVVGFAGGGGKDGMGAELQASVVVKKGKAATFAAFHDDDLMIRLDSTD